jgi:hypothetical protein
MSSFDDIRPYEDDEVTGVINRLLHEKDFLRFIGQWQAPRLQRLLPWLVEIIVKSYLGKKLNGVTTIEGFQQVVEFFVSRLIAASVTQFEYVGLEKLEPGESYLFISNHRDIAGDSMLLNYALFHSGLETVRIAVGDNLIQRQFATDLMKLNKSFFIRRSEEGARKVYAALMQSSLYIQSSMLSGNSVWIAQSEGRAKDGVDQTDPAVIKMLTLCNRKRDFGKTIRDMKIMPMSLAYEFDPCDAMKARELTALSETGEYQKTEGEDLLSLVQGLAGFKGRVTLRLGETLGDNFRTAEDVATEVDRQVVGNLELYSINYWALSQIREDSYSEAWLKVKDTVEIGDVKFYEARLKAGDESDRDQWLKMYANPVVNKLKSAEPNPELTGETAWLSRKW